MKKGDQIMAMVRREPRISLAVVAERVGCHPSYVRTAMHRAGRFRRRHDPGVVYDRSKRDRLATMAETVAASYEREAAACGLHQVKSVPEPPTCLHACE